MALGATLLHEPKEDNREAPSVQLTHLETGLVFPLRTVGHDTESSCPWLRTATRPCPFNAAMNISTKKKKPQDNIWENCAGESSASASASAEEGSWKGTKGSRKNRPKEPDVRPGWSQGSDEGKGKSEQQTKGKPGWSPSSYDMSQQLKIENNGMIKLGGGGKPRLGKSLDEALALMMACLFPGWAIGLGWSSRLGP